MSAHSWRRQDLIDSVAREEEMRRPLRAELAAFQVADEELAHLVRWASCRIARSNGEAR